MAIETVTNENFAEYVARNQPEENPVAITVGADSASTLVDPGNLKPGTAAAVDANADDKTGKGNAFQERINELTRLRKEADEFAEGEYHARLRSDQRIAQLESELEELRKAAPTAKVANDDEGKPDPSKYEAGQEQKYIDDLAKWHADRAVAKDRKEQERIRNEAAQTAEFTAMVEAYNARVAEFKKVQPDFQTVIDSVAEDPIRPWIRDAILESEHGPKLSYHLAQNPSLRVELNKMKATAACVRIGQLELELTDHIVKLDSQRRPTNDGTTTTMTRRIPAPITPVSGGEATVDKDPRQPMPYAEYKRMRRAGKIT